jgi:membrane-associated protease RseP (regulator of RpoE activity)
MTDSTDMLHSDTLTDDSDLCDGDVLDGVHDSVHIPEEELGIVWSRFGTLVGMLLLLLILGGVKMLVVALAIGSFLVIHEAGHYLTARWSGMKVTEFFVGFGPRIFAFKRGETTFGLKVLIPFGAYVRIVGMNNLEEVDPADEPRTYRQAAWHKRVLTILAGPATHFVTAFLLLSIAMWQFGPAVEDEDAWGLAAIDPIGAVADAGLESGDRIIQVNETTTETWDRFTGAVDANSGQTVEIVYQRFEDNTIRNFTSVLSIPAGATAGTVEDLMGFSFGEPDWAIYDWAVGEVTPFSAAEDAGVEPGDRILSIDGKPTPYFSDLAAVVPTVRGQEVVLQVERDGDLLDLDARIWERLTSEGAAGYNGLYVGEMVISFEGQRVDNYAQFAELASQRIGDTVEVEVVYDSRVHVETVTIDEVVIDNAVSGFLGVSSGSAREALPFTTAVARAPGDVVDLIGSIFGGVKQMVTTENGWRGMFALGAVEEDLSGTVDQGALNPDDFRPRSSVDNNRPISIIGVVGLANQLQVQEIIAFLAVMNLFFGLFNLAPLLPLDGGHIVLATYEKIRSIGRRTAYHADAAKLIPLTYVVVGFFLLVGMIAIVRDIVDPIQL